MTELLPKRLAACTLDDDHTRASKPKISGIAKGRPGWARPTHINCFYKKLVCLVTGIKRSIYSNKTVKQSIKTVSS